MKIVKNSLKCAVAFCFVIVNTGICELPVLETPTANLTEKWATNAGNWGKKDYFAPLTNAPENCWTTNMLSVSHAAGMNALPQIDLITGGTNASGSRFVGNYALKLIETIEFDVRTSGVSNQYTFAFNTEKAQFPYNVTWNYSANALIPCDTASNWVHVVIPMSYSTNWTAGDYDGDPLMQDKNVLFNEDKTNVVGLMINVYSPKNLTLDEKIDVSNLKLVGPWSGPFLTNGVSVAWLAEHGLNLEDAFGDSDNDGQYNDMEFLACTNPGDSNDVFRVEIGRHPDGQLILKWKENNRYAKYDLLEGTDLNDPATFKAKEGFANMQGSGTQKEAGVTEPAVTGPRFYKIQVKVP